MLFLLPFKCVHGWSNEISENRVGRMGDIFMHAQNLVLCSGSEENLSENGTRKKRSKGECR